MAKMVKMPKGREFAFKAGKAGGESKYDWNAWLNGDLLLLEQSTGKKDEDGAVIEVDQKRDYEVSTDAMVPKLKTAARKRYKIVLVSRQDADSKKLIDSLIIKARDMTDEEKVAEDEKRAFEKVRDEERKAERAQSNGDAKHE